MVGVRVSLKTIPAWQLEKHDLIYFKSAGPLFVTALYWDKTGSLIVDLEGYGLFAMPSDVELSVAV